MLAVVSIVLGVVSLFLSGVLAMGVAFATVMIAFMASRRRERYFIFAILLGSIVLVFVNLQNLNILQSGTKIQIEKVYQSLRLSNQVFSLMKNEDQGKVISTIDHSINIARKVDTEMLDRLLSGFKQHFEGEYLEGLTLLKQGIADSNFGIKMKGAMLVDLWAKWNADHKEDLEKLRLLKPSLAKFAFTKVK